MARIRSKFITKRKTKKTFKPEPITKKTSGFQIYISVSRM